MKLPALLIALLILSGCEFRDPVVEAPVQAPRIAYDTAMTFFTGAPDARAVNATGGPVTQYAVFPALPAGLSLDALTGEVSGTPAAASPSTRYTVTASGPGGTGSAAFHLAVYDIVLDSGSAKPRIAYATPVFDTLGKAASHAVLSTGGPVTAYAIHPALSAGLALNASTGKISGTPTAARAATDYTVIALGPGGRDTAVIRIGVGASFAVPRISYPDSVLDTVGVPARHVPTSTGGPVASYQFYHQEAEGTLTWTSLPSGLSLDPSTGVISGTPTLLYWNSGWSSGLNTVSDRTYFVIATGPGGKDTASIRIRIVQIYPMPLPAPEPGQAQIVLSLKLDSMNTPLSKLILRLQANTSSDLPIFDTILAGTQGFASLAFSQTVVKAYAVKPLRNWTATAVAVDTGGVPVRAGSAVASALKVGETRVLTVEVFSEIVVADDPHWVIEP